MAAIVAIAAVAGVVQGDRNQKNRARRTDRTPLNKSNMPDKNIGLTVDAEIAELIVAAWLEPVAKLNLPNSISRARFLKRRIRHYLRVINMVYV